MLIIVSIVTLPLLWNYYFKADIVKNETFFTIKNSTLEELEALKIDYKKIVNEWIEKSNKFKKEIENLKNEIFFTIKNSIREINEFSLISRIELKNFSWKSSFFNLVLTLWLAFITYNMFFSSSVTITNNMNIERNDEEDVNHQILSPRNDEEDVNHQILSPRNDEENIMYSYVRWNSIKIYTIIIISVIAAYLLYEYFKPKPRSWW